MEANEGNGRNARGGTVLEGKAGLVVAIVLAVVAVALAAVQWGILPDEVITHFNMTGSTTSSPKWVPVLLSAGLGLGGAGWLATARSKTGLVLSLVGVAIALMNLVVNTMLVQ